MTYPYLGVSFPCECYQIGEKVITYWYGKVVTMRDYCEFTDACATKEEADTAAEKLMAEIMARKADKK